MTAAAFIARTAGAPLVWGQNDCACWAASLVAEVTGRDPAADLRGTYATAWQCRQVVLRAGGLLTLCRQLMAGHAAGGQGDGVCVARVEGRALAGILSGGRLFLKADPGVLSPERFDLLETWVL